MLSQLTDIREKFINRFLFGSDITSMDFYTNEDVAATAADSTPPPPPPPSNKLTKQELFVRLLFFLESCQLSAPDFKDGFWLPIFFDVSFHPHASPSPILFVRDN